MGQSTEEIEAKLAAFVDGDLDAAGRDEIEKHLQANPQHRTLLDDLMRGRALLRDLPRETAPPDILDSIQSHLERRLLLDEQATPSRNTGGGLRRYMAVAAVLLLTGTLALVIYSVLPGSRHEGGLATALERAEPAAEPVGPPAPEVRVARSAGASSELARDDLYARAADSAVEAIRSVAGAAVASSEAGRRVEPDVARPAPAITLPSDAPMLTDAPLAPVIVLASDDLATTERELSAVMLENRVSFEQVAGGVVGRRMAEASPAPGAATDESVFVARKLTRAQYQAIEQAMQSTSRARKQSAGEQTQQLYQSFRIPTDERKAVRQDANLALKGKYDDAELAAPGAAKQSGSEPAVAAASVAPAATHPAEARIAAGDKLSINLPGMMQSNIGSAQVVEVTADGLVQVNPLDPVPAEGLTIDELQQKFAAMVGGPVAVDRVAEALTDVVIVVRPASVAEVTPGPTEAPSTQPAAAPSPATAPSDAGPATTPSTQGA